MDLDINDLAHQKAVRDSQAFAHISPPNLPALLVLHPLPLTTEARLHNPLVQSLIKMELEMARIAKQ